MVCKTVWILGFIFFGFSLASARVFYVDGPANVAPNPPRTSYIYPINYPANEPIEQSSRDLDMSFSAGDPAEYVDDRNVAYPLAAKNVYAYENHPDRPIIQMSRDYDRPMSIYKLVDTPPRRIIYGNQNPAPNRKIIRVDNSDGVRKGEIVLELRVTANSNNNEAF